MIAPNLPSHNAWVDPDAADWEPSPAGPVVGIVASLLVSAVAWITVVSVATEWLG